MWGYGDEIYYSDFLKKLNEEILSEKKSADYLIGHSYFMKKEKDEEKEPDLKNILNKNVIPLLMEYFNGKQEAVQNLLEKILEKTKYKTNVNNYYLQVEEA